MADRRPASEKPKGSGNPNRINRMLTGLVQKTYSSQSNLIVLSNKGLNSEQNTELRGGLRNKGIKLRIVRNRLTLRAFQDMGVKEAEKLFAGQTAIVEGEDPVAAAKLALEFCKKFDGKLVVVGGLVEGKILTAPEITALSKAKSKPEMLSEIAGLVRGPGASLAASIKGPGSKIAGQIKTITERLEKGEEVTKAS